MSGPVRRHLPTAMERSAVERTPIASPSVETNEGFLDRRTIAGLTVEQLIYIVVGLIAVFLRTYDLGRPTVPPRRVDPRVLLVAHPRERLRRVQVRPRLPRAAALLLDGPDDVSVRRQRLHRPPERRGVRPRRDRLRLAAAPLPGPLGSALLPAAGDLLAELDVLHPLHPPRHLPGALQHRRGVLRLSLRGEPTSAAPVPGRGVLRVRLHQQGGHVSPHPAVHRRAHDDDAVGRRAGRAAPGRRDRRDDDVPRPQLARHPHLAGDFRRDLGAVLHLVRVSPGEVERGERRAHLLVGPATDQAHRRTVVLLRAGARPVRAADHLPGAGRDHRRAHARSRRRTASRAFWSCGGSARCSSTPGRRRRCPGCWCRSCCR